MTLTADERHEALHLLRQARNRCGKAARLTNAGNPPLAASCEAMERQIADIIIYIETGTFPAMARGQR